MTDLSAFVPLAGPLRPAEIAFQISGEPAPAEPPDVRDAWSQLRGTNPRLHNGPIVSFDAVPRQDTEQPLRLRHDSYARLSVQSLCAGVPVSPRVWQLSVTGLVVAGDRVLLGRRSPETRIYGGLWECAPAGGIDVGTGAHTFDGLHCIRQLRRECAEELAGQTGAIVESIDRAEVVGFSPDPIAGSCDVVLRCSLDHEPEVCPRSWEYTEIRWADPAVALDDLELIPPTSGLLGWLSGRSASSG